MAAPNGGAQEAGARFLERPSLSRNLAPDSWRGGESSARFLERPSLSRNLAPDSWRDRPISRNLAPDSWREWSLQDASARFLERRVSLQESDARFLERKPFPEISRQISGEETSLQKSGARILERDPSFSKTAHNHIRNACLTATNRGETPPVEGGSLQDSGARLRQKR